MITINNNDLYEYYKKNTTVKKGIGFIDNLKQYYIIVKSDDDKYIKIPFDLFLKVDNTKLRAIFINYDVALNCASKSRCKLYQKGLCYACNDELQYEGVHNKNLLNALYIQQVKNSNEDKKILINYLNDNNNELVRFNKDSDFKSIDDLQFIIDLSVQTSNIFGGYTKNQQCIDHVALLDQSNLTVNNSFKDYIVTTNIKKYLNHNNKCSGYCNNCKKCYGASNQPRITLLHGASNKIDPHYNTETNRKFIITFFKNDMNIKLTHEDLTTNKGLVSSLNKYLRTNNHDIKFKNISELVQYIQYKGGY